ncbi:H0502G05.11 protein, putative [Theobroma cacao]|uniref:H0502G05.11 protein, putative n=1 Tax=Theobroma cacao TaxID=3641 RepID=A0A061FQK6_THECC|nr:H0502G05.11 protein, putative [Theobroma cacao]
MESSPNNQEMTVPTYVQELMKMLQASHKSMQVLEENNKRMIETITQFTSSTVTTSQPQSMPTHNGQNAANMVNNKGNGGNGESMTNLFFNTTNPFIVGNFITVATEPYPKDYTNQKFKQFNGKISDAQEHVMKFIKTLRVVGLDDDLKLNKFSKSLTEKDYTWYVNLNLGLVDS